MFNILETLWSMKFGFGFFLAFVSFNITMVIRFTMESADYTTKFRSFKFGDNIFLPIFGGFAAVVLQNYERQGKWYEATWWHILVLAIGLVVVFGLEGYIQNFPERTGRSFFLPSQGYHTIMFGVAAVIVVQTAITLSKICFFLCSLTSIFCQNLLKSCKIFWINFF